MLARVKIKTMIFHMANSITMLAFNNRGLLWKRSKILNKWRWISMTKPNTFKMNGIGIVWSMKGHFLVISRTSYVLVLDKLLPRSGNGLGKCRLNFCICSWIGYCINSFSLLMGVCLNIEQRKMVQNGNSSTEACLFEVVIQAARNRFYLVHFVDRFECLWEWFRWLLPYHQQWNVLKYSATLTHHQV